MMRCTENTGRSACPATWLGMLCLAPALLAGCLSPEQYAQQADEETYGIIDDKWNARFGEKGSYALAEGRGKGSAAAITGPVSLARAVTVATGRNRSYQRQKELLYLAALDLTLERHRFARGWLATLGADYSRHADDESVGADGALGVNQALADGADIGLGVALTWLEFLTGDSRSSLTTVLSASVNQPLLRGFGRKAAQEDLTQAERDALYRIRTFSRFRKTFVVSIVTDYFGVLQALDRVENDKLNYDNLLINQDRVKMMADTGRVPRFQASEVHQSVLQSLDRYTRSREAYEAALDQFKVRLALPADAKITLDPNELKALEAKGVAQPSVVLDAAVAAGLKLRLDLANSRDAIDDAQRKVVVAADALRAELNITARTDIPSTEPRDLTRMKFHKGMYGVGLDADLPLDRKAERNLYRKALIALADSKRTCEEQVDQVRLGVRQAHRDLLEAHTSYKIQQTSLELAEKRVAMQTALLEKGRATTRNYLDAQEDLVGAQNAKTAALVEYTLASLRFYRDIGLLQVHPDGMWRTPDDKALRRGPGKAGPQDIAPEKD
ncbi:MAG: TolC family protein [Phycisphaerae bacterium]|nr:TolC family protein [Phycisphaerae bacterium]